MMKYINNGLTLIHDLPEMVTPSGGLFEKPEIPIKVILQPANPCNKVTVLYRVDGGDIQKLQAVPRETNSQTNQQMFEAFFRDLIPGQLVEYVVTGESLGRQVPEDALGKELPHSFRVNDSEIETKPQAEQSAPPLHPNVPLTRYRIVEEFVARAVIQIEAPRIVGPTPDGIRVTWNAMSGDVVGPRLRAKLLQGADWMQVRTDGIANVNVRAILETMDGGRIMLSYAGVIELGINGYQNFLARNLPKTLKVWTTPLFLTAEKPYIWLNRLQCVSIGEVSLANWSYVYDIYALK